MKEFIEDLKRYVNQYGYFSNGKYLVDIEGATYEVEALIKALTQACVDAQ